MNNVLKYILLIMGLGCSVQTLAQDPQFSQFYNAPLYLNPGFAGITPQQRLVVNHRLQWPTLPKAFATYALSYDIFVDELKSGFGFMVSTDLMGSAGWRTTNAGLFYSYKLQVNKNWVFSPGLYFGYGQQNLDNSKIVLGDQLETGVSTSDPDIRRLGTEHYFDIGSGIVMYNRKFWFGISAYHLNTPNKSILGDEDRLPVKINVHAGMKVPLYNGPRTLDKVSYLTPAIIYRLQGPFEQLDVGLQYHIDPVAIGIWYRGIPVPRGFKQLDAQQTQVLQDALAFILALQFNSFQVGYSYDFTISDLDTSTGGAHEVSIVYEFVTKGFRRGVKRKNKLIPCPSFNSKDGFWN